MSAPISPSPSKHPARCFDDLIKFCIEAGVGAAASRDDFFGEGDVVREIVALLLVRPPHDAGADIADLVCDLDQLCAGRFVRGVLDLLLAAPRFRKIHVVRHLGDQGRYSLAEFSCQFLARGLGILDGVVQPAGPDQLGIGTIGCDGEQVCDLGEMVDVGLIAAALALLA